MCLGCWDLVRKPQRLRTSRTEPLEIPLPAPHMSSFPTRNTNNTSTSRVDIEEKDIMRVTVQKIRHRRWSCGQHCCSVKKLSEKKQVEIKRLQANLEVLQRTSLAATHDSEVPKLNPLVSSSDDRQNISQPLTPQCMVDCTLCDPVCNTKPLLAECLLWTVKWFSIKN